MNEKAEAYVEKNITFSGSRPKIQDIPLFKDKHILIRNLIAEKKADVLIEVDGGVDSTNAAKLTEAGVDVLVAGSYIFKSENIREAIRSLKG